MITDKHSKMYHFQKNDEKTLHSKIVKFIF